MSEDSGQTPPPDPGTAAPPPPPPSPPAGEPVFNPQTGYPVGSPNPYAGQQPYQAPGMAPFPVYLLPDHPKATAALVVGIVAVAGTFTCGLPVLASPVAWILGAQARSQIRREPHRFGGESKATAGMVLGIIGTVLLIVAVLAIAALIALSVSVDGTGVEGVDA